MTSMHYRPEIDGLRAIAVVPVILFHAGFSVFSGGFVGVDIFFVISGYLITTIILGEMRAGKFSLVGFYERRARRILPALYVVMLACIPIAWMLMLPDDLENFGQSLLATTLFANNVLLWITSSYFGLASEFKPLLHTWSLAVEEQFYIVFPVLLLLGWRLGARWLTVLLTVLLFASLAAAQWGSQNSPVAAFFLLPTRGWELLVGVLIALYFSIRNHSTKDAGETAPQASRSSLHEAAAWIGLALIAYAIFAFDKQTPFPSLYALVPTAGAGLIILFATPRTTVGKLLSGKLAVGIGLISYSAYLWHQPLLAFERISSLEEPGGLRTALSVAATFVLAFITWRFVEGPFRNKQRVSTAAIAALSIGVGLFVAYVGWQIYANSGYVQRWAELGGDEIKSAGRRLNAVYNERPFQYASSGFADPHKANVLVIGNSFARDFINAGLENNYFSNSEIAYSSSFPSCIADPTTIDPRLRTLIPQADYVIFGSPPASLVCWGKDLEVFKAMGARRVIVVGTKNFGWNLNAVVHLPAPQKYSYRAKVLDAVWNENETAARALPSSYFVNLLGLLADKDGRVPVFTDDGKIISQDRAHLTKAGAKFVGRKLFEHRLLAGLK